MNDTSRKKEELEEEKTNKKHNTKQWKNLAKGPEKCHTLPAARWFRSHRLTFGVCFSVPFQSVDVHPSLYRLVAIFFFFLVFSLSLVAFTAMREIDWVCIYLLRMSQLFVKAIVGYVLYIFLLYLSLYRCRLFFPSFSALAVS